MTVRRRLLVGVLCVLVVLIAGVGTAEVLVLHQVLYRRSAQGLRTELELLVASQPAPAPGSTTGSGRASISATVSEHGPATCSALGPVAGLGPGLGPPGAGPTLGPAGAGALAQVLAQRGIASAVVGQGGRVLACASAAPTGAQPSFAVPAGVIADLSRRAGGASYASIDSGGQHLLAIAERVGSDTAILVGDLGGDNAAIRTVFLVTVLGGIAALVVVALASRPLLSSALAPLRKIARTADAIAAGDLDQRSDLALSDDEVGRLGVAFDAMVDRLQASLSERDDLVAQAQLRELTLRQFLADASHELRTPLTAIRGGAQVLALGAASDPEELAESLGHIQSQAERMSRLVADLLLLSRTGSGLVRLPRETFDLGALLGGEKAHWQALCAGHPFSLSTEPSWVSGDRESLVRVVANLVENAAKYSPAGAPIEVRVRRIRDRVELAVCDQGPGIPVADRARVFERFYRGDPARARATGGAGLGLAIVAGIVAEHGGCVSVEDRPGGGTALVVRLASSQSGAAPSTARAR